MGEFPLLGKLCDNGELSYPLWALVRKQIGAKLSGRTWMNLEETEEELSPMIHVWGTFTNSLLS